MIAAIRTSQPKRRADFWHKGFLLILPAIRSYVRRAFAALPAEQRDEFVQEATVNALVAYRRLVERGKVELAYATPLARYAVAQTRAGRTIGNSLNSYEPLSHYAARKHGFIVVPLEGRHDADCEWQDVLVEDKRSGPAEVAATRLDFAAWLKTLPRRTRRIASTLALGETTQAAARQFGVSRGRISQIRLELQRSWHAFQGEGVTAPGGFEPMLRP